MLSIYTLFLFGVAAAAAIRRRQGWQIPLGLLLSAAGDAAGALGWFLPQMGLFAAALGCYLCEMVPHARLRADRMAWLLMWLPLPVGMLLLVRRIESPAEAVGVALYGSLLLALVAVALLGRRPRWGGYAAAALLFLISDASIGYARYVEPLPAADGWTLPPYCAAQALFALLAAAPCGPGAKGGEKNEKE